MGGGTKGLFSAYLSRVRIFDNVTHQMLVNVTSRENSSVSGNFHDYDRDIWEIRSNSPFYTAMKISNCVP
jgi:hypothetical protein